MRKGELVGHELYFRCPYCGDSPHNKWKAHFSVNIKTYQYFCFRCGQSGRLKMNQALELLDAAGLGHIELAAALEDSHEDRVRLDEALDELLPGPASPRRSALERWHLGDWDAFLSRNPMGDIVGIHYRHTQEKKMKTKGIASYGFAPDRLTSLPENPIRMVEGPYDVLSPRDVCVWGTLSYNKLAPLRGQFLLLCPDGDIWTTASLRSQFIRSIEQLRKWGERRGVGPWVVGVEFLPDGKDPDEVPVSEREVIPLRTFEEQLQR